MDDPDTIAHLRRTVKELLKYDSTEGFKKQREFLEGLYKLITEDDATFVKGGGLQILFPLLESKDVKTQGGAAAAVANLATKKPEYAVLITHEGGIDPLVTLCNSEVQQVQQCAIGAIGNMIRDPENAMNVAQHDDLLTSLGRALATSPHESVRTVSGNCLANFASHAEIRPSLRDERLHLALIAAGNKHDSMKELQPIGRALAAMALDAETQVLICQAGGLDTVLRLLRLPDPALQNFAMMALINICANTENADAVLGEEQALAALNHLARMRTDQFGQMAKGVIQKLQASKNSVIGEDVE